MLDFNRVSQWVKFTGKNRNSIEVISIGSFFFYIKQHYNSTGPPQLFFEILTRTGRMERYCDVEANGLINEDYEFDQAINIWIDLIDQKHS